MEENVFQQMLEKVARIEEEYGSLENFVIRETNLDGQHRMKVEEQYSSISPKQLQELEVSLRELELADLVDFQNFIGWFDGEFS